MSASLGVVTVTVLDRQLTLNFRLRLFLEIRGIAVLTLRKIPVGLCRDIGCL